MSPQTLTDQTFGPIGRLLIGTVLATGLVGGGVAISEFNSAGAPDPVTISIDRDTAYAYVTKTGSTTLKYPATCIENPLRDLGLGSGTVVRATYSARYSPAAAGGDVVFAKDCLDHTASGVVLIDNFCTSSGCVSNYTTGTAAWNSADYIKVIFRKDPTAGHDARLKLWYEDYYGE